MSDSIASTLNWAAGEEAQKLAALVAQTETLVGPVIEAMKMEGFYNFKPPCYDNPPSDQCTYGNRWSEFAQTKMGGLPNTSILNVTDAFHPVYQIPVHLPHTFNNWSQPVGCELQVSTVTQNVYNLADTLDTAFVPVAATTMRVKMESRQQIWVKAGKTPAVFNVTDAPSFVTCTHHVCGTHMHTYMHVPLHTQKKRRRRRRRRRRRKKSGVAFSGVLEPICQWCVS